MTCHLLFYDILCVFFFNDTATTEIYTLSLHDALPLYTVSPVDGIKNRLGPDVTVRYAPGIGSGDRKSTRLNSSHITISYAVFCLKKKKKNKQKQLLLQKKYNNKK